MTSSGSQHPAAIQRRIVSYALSDVGLHRQVNEDSILAEYPVYAIADGMGGHDAGDRASAIAVNEFKKLVGKSEQTVERVEKAIEKAQKKVGLLSISTSRGAGTTLTGLALVEHESLPHWLVYNVGDSRVYREFEGELVQITNDHSLLQELLDSGVLDESSAEHFLERNVITRALGYEGGTADFWLLPLTSGEKFLVCSDGLTGELSDSEIREILQENSELKSAAEKLLSATLAKGAHDNVSLILVEVLAEAETEAEAEAEIEA